MKILIVGLGSIGQRHLRNLRGVCEDVEILAYRKIGRNVRISDDMTAEFDVDLGPAYGIKLFDDYERALEEKPDAVLVTCPTKFHVPMALEAARHGCHLFIEKPLSDTLDGVEELAGTVETKGLVASIGYQLRFHPALKEIRRLIQEGAIGRVISAHIEFGEFLPAAHPYEDYREGYAARKDLGGGALLSLIHELDYAQWLFGMPRKVFALGGKLSDLDMDVDDANSILMECAISGRPVPVFVHLDFVQRPPSRTCSVIGEGGKVLWDYFSNRVDFYSAEKDEWESHEFPGFDRNDMFRDEMNYFVACVEGKEEPVVDIREGTKSLRIAMAARRSLQSGAVVEDI